MNTKTHTPRARDLVAAVDHRPAVAVFEGYVDDMPIIKWLGVAMPVGTELFAKPGPVSAPPHPPLDTRYATSSPPPSDPEPATELNLDTRGPQ